MSTKPATDTTRKNRPDEGKPEEGKPHEDKPIRNGERDAAPRTGGPKEQVKVWEEEGGSPPETISSTQSTRPKTRPADGSM